MIKDEDKDEMLRSISLRGGIEEENIKSNPIILGSRNNINHILNTSSGLPKIHAYISKRFQLIMSQPLALQALNTFEIRCCLCRNVISYPCWYYNIKYSVNHFHYFVCFDSDSSNKVTAKCFKR